MGLRQFEVDRDQLGEVIMPGYRTTLSCSCGSCKTCLHRKYMRARRQAWHEPIAIQKEYPMVWDKPFPKVRLTLGPEDVLALRDK